MKMIILALALALPTNLQGVWAPDEEACVGRLLYDDDGKAVGRDDPIERVYVTADQLIMFEEYGNITSVMPVGDASLIEVLISGEGEVWEDSYLLWTNGEHLMMDNVRDNAGPRSLVRC